MNKVSNKPVKGKPVNNKQVAKKGVKQEDKAEGKEKEEVKEKDKAEAKEEKKESINPPLILPIKGNEASEGFEQKAVTQEVKEKEIITKDKVENKEKAPDIVDDSVQKKRAEYYRKFEAQINEAGLTLAFNIIFAELIQKQILPENFFIYTAIRLKQIGKEIEGLKTRISIAKPVEVISEKEELKQNNKGDDLFITGQKPKEQPSTLKEQGNSKLPPVTSKEKDKEKDKVNEKEEETKDNKKQLKPKGTSVGKNRK